MLGRNRRIFSTGTLGSWSSRGRSVAGERGVVWESGGKERGCGERRMCEGHGMGMGRGEGRTCGGSLAAPPLEPRGRGADGPEQKHDTSNPCFFCFLRPLKFSIILPSLRPSGVSSSVS